MTTEEQYKNFIKNCTTSPKSVNNYSDFKRINETVAKIKGVDSFDIYSCVHTKELQDIIDSLNNNEEFKQYEKTGSNQYSNALKTYMRFLYAKEIFQNEAKKIKAPFKSYYSADLLWCSRHRKIKGYQGFDLWRKRHSNNLPSRL